MEYTLAEVAAMSEAELLAAWESIHGTHLTCKCRYCNGPQPIVKFKSQITRWTQKKNGGGLNSATPKPKTCDFWTEENNAFNAVKNKYYSAKRKLEASGLSPEEFAARLGELKAEKDNGWAEARVKLNALRAAREATTPKTKPKILRKKLVV